MPPKKNQEQVIEMSGSAERDDKQFQSELAVEILGELYPLLLENCTDDDDEVDTQAVFEVLAGMMGLFIADYQTYYGEDKAMAAMQDLVDMALNLREDRLADTEEQG